MTVNSENRNIIDFCFMILGKMQSLLGFLTL